MTLAFVLLLILIAMAVCTPPMLEADVMPRDQTRPAPLGGACTPNLGTTCRRDIESRAPLECARAAPASE
jgi:hypothetical protein